MKKKILYLFVLLLTSLTFLSSCSEEKEVDIRDTYVGTYVGKRTYTNGGTNYTGDVTVKVTKSSVPGTIVIESIYYKTLVTEYASANASNGTFSTAFTSSMDGITETITVFNGKIDGKTISFSFSAQGYVTITVNATKL